MISEENHMGSAKFEHFPNYVQFRQLLHVSFRSRRPTGTVGPRKKKKCYKS